MESKPLENSAWDNTEVIDALSDGDADGMPDDTPRALMRDMERDMEIDPQAMMAYIRDMEKKMAAMTRQIASIPPVERSAGLVEPRKIHRPLQSAEEPREIHRPLRTSLSPRHEERRTRSRRRNARAPTSTRSIGFCVIWVCISSSSSSMWGTQK